METRELGWRSWVASLAAATPAGAAVTAVFLVAAASLDPGVTLGALAVATALVPLTAGVASLGVDGGPDTRTLARRFPAAVLAWAGSVAVQVVVAIGFVATIGGGLGTLHAVGTFLRYEFGARPPAGPVFTPAVVVGVVLLGLAALAVARLPTQFVLARVLVDGRRPTAALRDSLEICWARPRAALEHWARTTGLAMLPALAVVLALGTGAVRPAPSPRTDPTVVGPSGPELLALGAVCLALATMAFAARARQSVAALERHRENDRGADTLAVSKTRAAAVVVVLLVVASLGAGLRVGDVRPTADATQSVAGVEDPARLLSVAVANRDRTSHERITRTRVEQTERRLSADGRTLDRRADEDAWYTWLAVEREQRELAVYAHSTRASGIHVRRRYVTDGGEFFASGFDDGALTADGPAENWAVLRRGDWEAVGHQPTSFGDVDRADMFRQGWVLGPTPSDARNLTVLRRNGSRVVLGITDTRAALSYHQGGHAFPRDGRAFVAENATPGVEAVRGGAERATVAHDAAVRIVVETETGRVQRTSVRTVTSIVERARGEDGERAEIEVDTITERSRSVYDEYGTVEVTRPAGVPGWVERPVGTATDWLVDYLRY